MQSQAGMKESQGNPPVLSVVLKSSKYTIHADNARELLKTLSDDEVTKKAAGNRIGQTRSERDISDLLFLGLRFERLSVMISIKGV